MKIQLQKHINLKHTKKGFVSGGIIKCRNCEEEFRDKRNLMMRRKSFHSATVAVCRNYLEKNCSFTADACWWNHQERENASGVMCFICSEVFETRSEMMKHRKTNHANIVQQCSKFVEGNCQFQEKFCWFKHFEEIHEENDDGMEEEEEVENQSVFQNARKNPKHPLRTRKENLN